VDKENIRAYRGIVIFGLPGSGKTSTALALNEKLSNSVVLEASRDIVLPLLNSTSLPLGLDQVAAEVARLNSSARSEHLLSYEEFRVSARYLFANLSRAYGEDWVAHVVEAMHGMLFAGKLLIVSGVRGVENARRLQSAGYLVIFLAGDRRVFAERRSKRDRISLHAAKQEQEREEAVYHTRGLERFTLAVDSSRLSLDEVCERIFFKFGVIECKHCVNSRNNPTISFSDGICSVCQSFKNGFDPSLLLRELEFVRSFRSSRRGVLIGMSGGKDSTATAFLVKELGLKQVGFTFDIGYYPAHIFSRAKDMAEALGLRHEVIPIKRYISEGSIESYRRTSSLYDLEESEEASRIFRRRYSEARRHYSVKDQTPLAYVRSCQLCRKTVIPAYYEEAVSETVRLMILGINEWASLSQSIANNAYVVSGLRRLKPYRDKPSVYVAHLPFILRITRRETEEILQAINWSPPTGEDFVETNSNSCLFARAAEQKAKRMLKFHPDSTRLSREATVGFLSKQEARTAIEKEHPFETSVREVLTEAGLLG